MLLLFQETRYCLTEPADLPALLAFGVALYAIAHYLSPGRRVGLLEHILIA